jgi:hypothetical protein
LPSAIGSLGSLIGKAGDEFQTSEPSEEVPNPIDEHPEEEQ